MSLAPCSGPSRTLRAACGDGLRPSLTAPVRAAIDSVQVGTKERRSAQTKEQPRIEEFIGDVAASLTRRGLRVVETKWRIGLPGACEHWSSPDGLRGLSAHEIARARISIVARSTERSNQRPDTSMQDRIRQIVKNRLRRTAGPYILAQSGRIGVPQRLGDLSSEGTAALRQVAT